MIGLKDLRVGDFLSYWKPSFDRETNRPAEELCYARVVRKGPRRVLVRDREGVEKWRSPGEFFARIDDEETIADLLGDDFRESDDGNNVVNAARKFC